MTTVKVNGDAKLYGLLSRTGDYAAIKELKKDGTFHNNRKSKLVHIDDTNLLHFDKNYGVGQNVILAAHGMPTDVVDVGNYRVRGSFSIGHEKFNFEASTGYHRMKVDNTTHEIPYGLCFGHIWTNEKDDNHSQMVEYRSKLREISHMYDYSRVNIINALNTLFNDSIIGNVYLEEK